MSSKGFRWSPRRDEAALLVARDDLSNEEIARKVGVSRQALDKWKRNPDFAARVDQFADALRKAVLSRGIAQRRARIAALDDRWNRLREVIEARGLQMAHIPGGRTGLLVRRVKLVKVCHTPDGDSLDPSADQEPVDEIAPAGKSRSVGVVEFTVDVPLLRELREHERQAAVEQGEWGKGASSWEEAYENLMEAGRRAMCDDGEEVPLFLRGEDA